MSLAVKATFDPSAQLDEPHHCARNRCATSACRRFPRARLTLEYLRANGAIAMSTLGISERNRES